MLTKTEKNKIKDFLNELPPICNGAGMFIDFIVVLSIFFTFSIIDDCSNIAGKLLACSLITILFGIPYFIIMSIITVICINIKNDDISNCIEKQYYLFGITFGIGGIILYMLKYKYKLDCISSMLKTDKMIDEFDKLIK